jgi:LacI family transcriptional regulator
MPNTPASLQDIAARLGVHPSTVSRALRNHPAISEAVRLRVQAVAREFAYKPNPLIAALVRSRKARRAGSYRANLGYVYTAPVGRVTAWRKDYDALFSGARTRARFLGYELEEFNLSGTRFTPRRFTQILLTRNILGLILPPLYATQDALPVEWEQRSFFRAAALYSCESGACTHNREPWFLQPLPLA